METVLKNPMRWYIKRLQFGYLPPLYSYNILTTFSALYCIVRVCITIHLYYGVFNQTTQNVFYGSWELDNHFLFFNTLYIF